MTIYRAHELEAALAAEWAAWRLVRAQLPHVDPEKVDMTSISPVQVAAVEALLAARSRRRQLLSHVLPPQP